jgi:hypothetical protein
MIRFWNKRGTNHSYFFSFRQICEHLIAASSPHSFVLIRLTEISNSMFCCDADSDDTSAKSDNISGEFELN